MDPLRDRVRRARIRLVGAAILKAVARGAVLGSILLILYIILDRIFRLELDPMRAAAILLGIPLLFFLVRAATTLPTRADAAFELDQRFGLRERVATALALEDDPAPIAEAVRQDARDHLSRMEVKGGVPVGLPREALWLLFLIIAIAFIASERVFPYIDVFGKAEAQQREEEERREVRKKARKIAEGHEKIRKKLQGKKVPQDVQEALKEWERLGQDLQKSPETKRDALVKLSKVQDSIKQKKEQTRFSEAEAVANALKENEKSTGLTAELQTALRKGDLEAAAKALDKLQKEMEAGNLSPEMMDKLKAELESLSMDLMANKELSEALSDAAEDLADDELQDALRDLEEAELTLVDMAEALEELALLEDALEGLEDQKKDLFLDEEEILAALEAEICEDCGGTMEDIWEYLEELEAEESAQGEEGEESGEEKESAECRDCEGGG